MERKEKRTWIEPELVKGENYAFSYVTASIGYGLPDAPVDPPGKKHHKHHKHD